jgi:hypothetical protein
VLDEHKRNIQDSRKNDEGEHEVVREVECCVNLDAQRKLRFPDDGQDFSGRFDCAFCPTELLRFERVDFRRQFRRRSDIVEILELPAAKLCTIAQVVYIVSMLLVIYLLPKVPTLVKKATKIDWVGTILITVGVVPFLLALSWGGSKYQWSNPIILVMLAVAVVFLVMAAIYEKNHEEFALLNIKLLRRRNYTFAILISLFMTSTMTGFNTFGSLYVQGVMGKTATVWSAIGMPATIVSMFTGALASWAMDKTKRYKWLLIIAPLCGTITMVIFKMCSPMTPIAFMIGLAIFNKVTTYYMPSVNVLAAMAQVEPEIYGSGTGTLYFITMLGGSIYPALFGSILNGQYATAITANTASFSKSLTAAQINIISTSRVLVTPAAMKSLAATFGANTTLYNQTVDAVRNSLQTACNTVFITAGIFSLGAIIMALLIKEIPLDQIQFKKK